MLARTLVRTMVAASAMATALLLVGTDRLSPAQWLVGAATGGAAYVAVLFITHELSVPELRALAGKLWTASRPALH
jgi:hypothetical protein